MAKRRKRFRRINWPLVCAWLILLALLLSIYGISVAFSVQRRVDPISMQMELEAALLNRAFDLFVGFWFFVLGSCIGSFLNVVGYRVPAGISLVGSSRCPFCYVPIESRDNIPILGWIGLRGRCRACRLPISLRYPVVEALCGAAFLMIYLSAIWFPTKFGTLPTPLSGTLSNPYLYVYLRGGLLMFLMSWLIALALVRMDGERIPLALSAFGILAAILSLFLPGCLDLFHSVRHDDLFFTNGLISEVILKGYGMAVGSAFGILLYGANRSNASHSLAGSILVGISLGACFGWPVTAMVLTFGIFAEVLCSRDDLKYRIWSNPFAVVCIVSLFLYMLGAWMHVDERFMLKLSSLLGY